MRRSLTLALLASAVLAAPVSAAELPENAKWTEATIPSTDGVELHADILRPANLPDDAKTPVILSIGPYFNHSGQTGAVGPAQGTGYDPVSPSEGTSERFHDLIEGAKLMERGYTFVMVDLRGFGGSNGCLDWGGPGEQADVVKAVEWAADQSWSTGAVGMYGKSYDGVTGLIGVNLAPRGLKAVVSQEPVYDLYRYLYGDGMRRANSLLTPALYDGIAGTPGPLGDGPAYFASSVNTPDCLATNWAAQFADDDHQSAYWKQRDLIPGAKGSQVPLFLTQGLTENNTAPDGLAEYMENHTGYERAWLGPWEHVRGAETDENGRLLMGRAGWYDEVVRFYDKFLKGIEPAVQDPMVAVQTNDGKWRGEDAWPPADAQRFTTTLRPGEYEDTGQSYTTGSDASATSGVWTISKPLPYDVHLAGAGQAVLDVETQLPNANLVVDVYDLDAEGKGPLIARQGHLVREPGQVTLNLMSADWKLPAGHRIGVRVTDTNLEWWLLTLGTQQPVTVKGGSISLPFLRYQRTDQIQGDPGTQLEGYLEDRVELPAELVRESEADFALPPAMEPRPQSGGKPRKKPKPVNARLQQRRGGGVVVAGSAPKGARLGIELRRAGRTVARKRTVARRGTFRVAFPQRRAGRYSALIRSAGRTYAVRSVRVR